MCNLESGIINSFYRSSRAERRIGSKFEGCNRRNLKIRIGKFGIRFRLGNRKCCIERKLYQCNTSNLGSFTSNFSGKIHINSRNILVNIVGIKFGCKFSSFSRFGSSLCNIQNKLKFNCLNKRCIRCLCRKCRIFRILSSLGKFHFKKLINFGKSCRWISRYSLNSLRSKKDINFIKGNSRGCIICNKCS